MPAVGLLSEFLSPDQELEPKVSLMQRQQARSECWSFSVLLKTSTLETHYLPFGQGHLHHSLSLSLKEKYTIMLP